MQTMDVRTRGALHIIHILLVFGLAYMAFTAGQLYATHQLTQDLIEQGGK